MERRQSELPWYRKWFDERYLVLYRHRDTQDAEKQFRLIYDVLKPAKSSFVLDLGCGEGRHTVFFKDAGFRVVGIDLSKTLIESGREKYPRLDLVVGDMRRLPVLPGRFDLVLSLFTSFGYFENDDENQQVVCSIFCALKPGGVFWIDFLNAVQVESSLVPDSLSRGPGGIELQEKRRVTGGRIVKDIYFKDKKNGDASHYRESVRLFSRLELEAMLERSGFRVEGCFGDYGGAAWTENSERTILFARKEN